MGVSCRGPGPLVQGPHVPVSQCVVHVLQLLPGGGGLANVVAAALTDSSA